MTYEEVNRSIADAAYGIHNAFVSGFHDMTGNIRYVPPCESDEFNERGTPIGYYVDAFGGKIMDDVREEYKAPFVDIFEATKGFYRDSDVIDVTFEEVKEDEDN